VGKKRNTYRILGGRPEGKRQLGKSLRRWVDIITTALRKMGEYGLDSADSG
jgi:hypothetical protein